MRLCCSQGDKDDGDQRPPAPRPVPIPDTCAGKPQTTNTTAPIPPSESASITEQKPIGSPDLWKEAYESLGEDRKDLVSLGSTGSSTDAINGVIEQTEERYREWKKGGLTIRRSDGNNINVRSSAERILNAAMQARDLIATVAALDPTGKASAAWTVVSLGLTMVHNDIERRDAVFAASEYLAENLAYYSLVDAHYRDQKVEGGQNFDRALVRVYTAILDYTAEVKKVQKEKRAVRMAKSIRALADQPLTQLKAMIEEQSLAAEKWADFTNNMRSRELAQKTLAQVDESVGMIKKLYSKALNDEERKIMDWVSVISYSNAQIDTQKHRTPDTGNWLLKSKEYRDWKSSPGSILWLRGVVGCGKSVLCSTAIQDIENLCEEEESKSLGYWYFQFNNDKTQSVDNMVRSLIQQLSRSPLDESVTKAWEKHSRKNSQPNRESLLAMLDSIITSMPSDVFVVFDALDECPQTSSQWERQQLLSILVDLAKKHKDNLHILATSRPEQDIAATMGRFPLIDLEERLAKDVETFVHARLAERLSDLTQATKALVIDALLNNRERRFRWTDLQLKRLEGCPTDKRIREALRTIPKDLADTYKSILDGIDDEDRSMVREMLMLLAFPAGALDLKTVASFAGLRSPNYVLKICTTSLLSVLDDQTVKLAHFSVKEYLVISKDADKCDECRFSQIAAQEHLARKTVDCLLAQTEKLGKEDAMSNAFLVYAAIHWPGHIAALGDISLWPDDLPDKVDRLFTEPMVYFNWIRIFEHDAIPQENPWGKLPEECLPPIYRASELSLLRTVDLLINDGADPLQCFRRRACPMELAVKRGRLAVVDLMLKKKLRIPGELIKVILSMINLGGDNRASEASQSELATVMNTIRELGILRDTSGESGDVIPERYIWCAFQNFDVGPLLVNQLLDWRDTGLASFSLPDDIVRTTMIGTMFGNEMLDLLFERCNDEIHIPPTLFSNRHVLRLVQPSAVVALARRRPAELPISDALLNHLGRKLNAQDLQFMLQTYPDIRVTEAVLVAGAENQQGLSVFQLLWDRRVPGTSVTEDMLISAATREEGKVLEFLIAELGPGTRLSDKVVEQVIHNRKGMALVRMIWGSGMATFDVSERVIEAAVSRYEAPLEMLQLLINNSMSEIPVTEAIVCGAAQNRCHASSLITYLSHLQEEPIPITEEALVLSMNSDHNTLAMLMDNYPELPISDRVFLEACSERDALALLLDKHGDRAPVQQIIEKFTTYHPPSDWVLEMLLDRQLVTVDEKLLEAVAGRYGTLSAVLTRAPDTPISHHAWVQAAMDPRSIRLLLDKYGSVTPITEDIIIGAMKSDDFRETVEAIIHRTGLAPITKNVLRKAMRERPLMVPWLLQQRPNLNIAVDDLLKDVWLDMELPAEHKFLAFFALPELQVAEEPEITRSMLEKCPYDAERKENFGLDGVVEEIAGSTHCRLPESELEQLGEIVVERCGHAAVETFLGSTYTSNLTITDTILQAAERNVIADRHVLMSVLSKRRAD
ncbi:hypothetical protein BJX68DRAFT_228219 [Aspergillus pseudodeflectus]|uniref:Nephrocystin 3-like N-terminal domain-containing protein n=1 Tax=Aspergillus pseudodeflectus TaxID=176178 RepID=A0ABR4L147_9EURO